METLTEKIESEKQNTKVLNSIFQIMKKKFSENEERLKTAQMQLESFSRENRWA